MRLVLGVLLVAGAAAAAPRSDIMASLEGVVTGAKGGSVVLHLEPTAINPLRYYDGYEVTAGQDGRFDFEDIQPAGNRLTAQAKGFGMDDAAGVTVTLHSAERLTGITLTMFPLPVISGRITEPTGVTALRYDAEFNSLTYAGASNPDANGNYRIQELSPGIYYVRANRTWHPGSNTFGGAKPVVLRLGEMPPPVDIDMQGMGCLIGKVSGRIDVPPGRDKVQYEIQVEDPDAPTGGDPRVGFTDKDRYDPGDKFTASACPGDYDIVLKTFRYYQPPSGVGGANVVYDRKHVRIGSAEIRDFVLTPRPMASIRGEVQFEGVSDDRFLRHQVSILRQGDGQFQTALLDSKRRIEFHDVEPGEYSISLEPGLRAARYIKSITVDGTPVDGRRFRVPDTKAVTVNVTLSGNAATAAGRLYPDPRRHQQRWEVAWTRPKGSISGTIEGYGDPSADVTIRLRSARFNSDASAGYDTRPAADGSFRLDDIDPGVYTLEAESKGWRGFEYGAAGAGGRGVPLVVGRGAHLEKIRLALPKPGSLCGLLKSADGSLRDSTEIYLNPFGSTFGNIPVKSELVTDGHGRFRAEHLLPGDYFPAFWWANRFVFFSGDGALAGAKPIHIEAGETPGCGSGPPLEFRRPAGIDEEHRVSGRVAGELPTNPGDRFWIFLYWLTKSSSLGSSLARTQIDAQHRFVLQDIPNGRFVLQLVSDFTPKPERLGAIPMESVPRPPPPRCVLATQIVEVGGIAGDVTGLEIRPIARPSIKGSVHLSNVPEPKASYGVSGGSISLGRYYATISPDNRFKIESVEPGLYDIRLRLRHPLYIRSMRLDGQEVRGRYLRVPSARELSLEIEVSGDAGQVTASVVPDPSLPLAEPSLRGSPHPDLILVPVPLDLRRTERGWTEPILVHGWGVAVPPGRYRALLVEQWNGLIPYEAPRDLSDDERRLWMALAALGRPVKIEPGAKLEIALRDRTIDAVRVAAKLGVPAKVQQR